MITLGEMVATSAIDITGEGFQKVDMSDFSTRMAINLTTFGLTELASNGTKGLVKNTSNEGVTVLWHYPEYVDSYNFV